MAVEFVHPVIMGKRALPTVHVDDPDVAAHDGNIVLVYHLLWELTHVVFEHPGLVGYPSGTCENDIRVTCADGTEPTAFLYPFIDAGETDADLLLADLVDDRAVLTALANDVGFELVFSCQLIAHAGPDDVDHCLVVRSDSVHRIQETQDAVVHELWARCRALREGVDDAE